MAAPLRIGALVSRTLSLLWKIPILAVNHCIARKLEKKKSEKNFTFFFSKKILKWED